MKYLIIAATAATMAISSVAIAQTTTTAPAPANKVDCEKAKMKWDDKALNGKGACMSATAAPSATAPAKPADPMKK